MLKYHIERANTLLRHTILFGDHVVGCTGTDIENIKAPERISITPNPAHHSINISSTEIIHTVSITNLLGQVVYEGFFNDESVVVPVSNLANGLYFVKVNGVYAERIVKE